MSDTATYKSALGLVRRGRRVIPVAYGEKTPGVTGWQKLRLTEPELGQYFNGQPVNLGQLNGEPSGGIVVVDQDAREVWALASQFLPPTSSKHGRPSAPASHWEYVADPPLATVRLRDPTEPENGERSMLVEALSTGTQVLMPPSVHPSGEIYEWYDHGDPARVDGEDLVACCKRLAAAALLARHWPRPPGGKRQEIALALAGGLLRGGWSAEETAELIRVVAEAAGDEETAKRATAAEYTRRRLRDGGPATGWTALAKLLDRRVVQKVREWLGARERSAATGGATGTRTDRPRLADVQWPDPLDEAAYYGVAGEVVRAIEPYSEADPAAILLHFLCGFGALVGPKVCAIAGDARHPARLNGVCVGETSKGRKGSAARPIERLLGQVDETFPDRVTEGLSSGEGLIWAVRDPIFKWEKPRQGHPAQEVMTDPGVQDKRLWVIESEFASVLRMVQRDGNTLSVLIRRAWDRGDLQTLTKNSPAKASGAHISITGHVTKDELLRYIDRSELASGFANRHLWFATKRWRILPEGEQVPEEILARLADRLRQALVGTDQPRVIRRDEDAKAAWAAVYGQLSEGRSGLYGAATSRGEAQVLRLSVVYALLDGSEAIQANHLRAAVAVWEYADRSARWIFGDFVGDPIADAILTALKNSEGLTRTETSALFGRNVSSAQLDRALGVLIRAGRVRVEDVRTGGRPREVWRAI